MRLAFLTPLLVLACTTHDTDSVRRSDSARAAADSASPAESRDRRAAADSALPATDAVAPNAATAGPSGVEYYPAARLNQVAESLSHGSTTGHTLGAHGTFQYLQIRRVASGVPEIHDRWIDVTTVQSGRGSLLSGGRVTGGVLQGGGEHRGGQIVGGSRRPVAAGDLMIIAAGVPHQYEIARGDSLRYLTVKVLAPPH